MCSLEFELFKNVNFISNGAMITILLLFEDEWYTDKLTVVDSSSNVLENVPKTLVVHFDVPTAILSLTS
jgi:hypothetical protein